MAKFGNSSFWIEDFYQEDEFDKNVKLTKGEINSQNLYKLASSKRAISNFVRIVTNESIPVTFNERGDSYTDGKSVVIGSNVTKPKDFDVVVGLALHEGSHIKLSDFNLLHDIRNLVPSYVIDGAIKKGVNEPVSVIKNLWNYVEDRRIDQFVFDSAPGYRDYYRAMYDKYFNDKLIDKALLSDEYTEESVDSYMFRIINLHNKNSRLDVLKGLRKIHNLIDLSRISRLTSSKDTFEVAINLFKVILDSLPSGNSQSQSSNSDTEGEEEGRSSESSLSQDSESSSSDSPSNEGQTGGEGQSTESEASNKTESSSENSGNSKSDVELTERQKNLLPKKIEKQKDFLNGDVKKTSISKKESNELKTIEESGTELTTVGKDITSSYFKSHSNGIETVVVKKMTENLMRSNSFPLSTKIWQTDELYVSPKTQEAVTNGIRMGTVLGRKLQVRAEQRNTIYNRQKNGKIDRRMVASLGFGNENVFQYLETDSYKNANLHVSVDASGSMYGEKWYKTMTNVVSLAKAVDMIPNLSIQISFRTTQNDLPYVVLAYDSNKDKFTKVKKLFHHLEPNGTTPEGLCFEAIMNQFLPSDREIDSYFLNLSDGAPYFVSGKKQFYYAGDDAYTHTRKMVKKIEEMGINVLSYFIDEYADTSTPSSEFIRMYGKSSVKIDVTNSSQIVKTMNKLFLEKEK